MKFWCFLFSSHLSYCYFSVIDTVVYTIKATDKDEEKTVVYSEYQYANEKSKDVFKIDANTGKITLNKPLDYEILDEHVITYKAQDQSTTPLFCKYWMLLNYIFSF